MIRHDKTKKSLTCTEKLRVWSAYTRNQKTI